MHISVKLHWIFSGAPLTFNGTPGNIQGNLTGTHAHFGYCAVIGLSFQELILSGRWRINTSGNWFVVHVDLGDGLFLIRYRAIMIIICIISYVTFTHIPGCHQRVLGWTFYPWIICRSVTGLVTSCPSGVWCHRGLTTCPLYVVPPFI